jgi:hypothetical protein
MKVDFKIALLAGLIGTVAQIAGRLTEALVSGLTPRWFSSITFFLSWLISIAVGMLYVYLLRRRKNTVRVSEGALGGLASGVVSLLAGTVVMVAPMVARGDVEGQVADLAVEPLVVIAVLHLFLSAVGGLIFATRKLGPGVSETRTW